MPKIPKIIDLKEHMQKKQWDEEYLQELETFGGPITIILPDGTTYLAGSAIMSLQAVTEIEPAQSAPLAPLEITDLDPRSTLVIISGPMQMRLLHHLTEQLEKSLQQLVKERSQ